MSTAPPQLLPIYPPCLRTLQKALYDADRDSNAKAEKEDKGMLIDMFTSFSGSVNLDHALLFI